MERQACQTVAALGATLQQRFQAAAAQLLPGLFSMLVMSIQVQQQGSAYCNNKNCRRLKSLAFQLRGSIAPWPA